MVQRRDPESNAFVCSEWIIRKLSSGASAATRAIGIVFVHIVKQIGVGMKSLINV